MLHLVKIKKNYPMRDQEPVRALRDISIKFRQNEFVAVLGPSGCGKTTLLNIIGGLDRYTRGDLIIKNKSTRNYTDYDWDTYRNHSIGFVFQTYNLIAHQTLARNVELALTIAGVSKKERKERAYEALAKVGLQGLEKKKPNQLSGGQMQRVANARALVNNPEILLADEPTGALDSETSTQIVDLLKEVAKDRLVIMVTHNPDLASRYATRIVNMIDGVITGDSHPYDGKKVKDPKPLVKQKKSDNKKGKSSMSFITATSLSVANLISKAKRTILVAFAGSIGIFGVSTVLAASTGVRSYIGSMQNDMLSSYPLTIEEEAVDYSSIMEGMSEHATVDIPDFDITTEVGLNSVIDFLMKRYKDLTQVKTNTINEDLVQFVREIPESYVSALSFDYGTDVTNNIFTTWKPSPEDDEVVISLNGLTQRYIAELKTVEGFSQYASYVDLFTDFMHLIPSEAGAKDYILSQYDLLGDSRFPEGENEIMLVVGNDTTLTDLNFAQLGFYEEKEVINIARKAIAKYEEDNTLTEEELEDLYPYTTSFQYETLLDKKLYYLAHDEIYHYDDIKLRDYTEYSATLTDSTGMQLFALQYNEASDILTGGVIKLPNLNYDIVYFARNGLKNPNVDPIYGSWIGQNVDGSTTYVLTLNEGEETTTLITNPGPEQTITTVSTAISATPREETITDYQYSAEADINAITNKVEVSIAGILKPKQEVTFGTLSRGVYYTKAFQDRYMEDAFDSEIIRNENYGFNSYIGSEAEKSSPYKAYVTFNYTDYTDGNNPIKNTKGYASSLNGDIGSGIMAILNQGRGGGDYLEQDAIYLRALSGLKIVTQTDDEDTLTYHLEKLPDKMSIFPENFNKKRLVTDYLETWNEEGDLILYEGTLQEKVVPHSARDELTYSDVISLIISVIDRMITIITVALVVFTSLSLVVSCFMIAVITYISVIERVKEIGVIRSLGGRKKDVSRLFIAENLITGALSGVIGLTLTAIVSLIINIVVSTLGVPAIAILSFSIIGIMLLLSIFLSVMAGLIPSMHASRQDPVVALRSE
ncbi:MAG: ABC transporter ATP-binding protein/permease [Erysipelotrichia bacterium]|nr:ABC transporter ATP-binding protein/permease [Erysipelotrichia bacterium]